MIAVNTILAPRLAQLLATLVVVIATAASHVQAQTGYDLEITSGSVDDVIYDREFSAVSFTVMNNGNVNFNVGVQVVFTLVDKDDLSDVRTVGFDNIYTPIGPGSSVVASSNSLYCSGVFGDYLLKIELDPYGELDETDALNNTFFFPVTVYTNDYYWQVAELPSAIYPNVEIEATLQAGFIGRSDLTSLQADLYLSTDDVWDAGDELVGSHYVDFDYPIEADFGKTTSITQGQNLYLILKSQLDGSAFEPDYDNNIVIQTVQVEAPFIDLEPWLDDRQENWLSDLYLYHDESESWNKFGVVNTGNKGYDYDNSDEIARVKYYVSTDDVLNTNDDLMVLDEEVPRLDPGRYHRTRQSFSLPVDFSSTVAHFFIVVDEENNVTERDESNNIFNFDVPVYHSNLSLRNVVMDGGQIRLSQPFDISFELSTSSRGKVPEEIAVGFFLSSDDTFGNDDVLLKSTTLSGVSDVDRILTESIIIESQPEGAYHLFIKVDHENLITEKDEEDNMYNRSFTLESELPDLSILSADIPAVVPNGVGTEVSFQVQNNSGVLLPVPFHYSIFVGRQPNLDGSEELVFEASVDPLGPNATVTVTEEVLLSFNTTIGDRYIIIQVDSRNDVVEKNEDNNIYSSQVQVEIGLDAAVLGGDVQESFVEVGDNMTVRFDVANYGTEVLNNISADLFLSGDRVFDGNDFFLQTECCITVNPNDIDQTTRTIQIPNGMGISPSDLEYLIVKLDIVDANPENDVRAIPVNATEQKDIEISDIVNVPSLLTIRGWYDLTAAVWNSGDQFISDRIYWYLSADAVFDVNEDTALDDQNFGLSNGEVQQLTKRVEIPSSISPGDYYLMAVFDTDDNHQEISEENNVYLQSVFVRHGDLSIQINNLPAATSSDQTITVDYEVFSDLPNGDNAVVRFVLSEDDNYDPADVILLSFSTTGISSSRDVDIPSDLSSGDYYFLAVIDPNNVYEELDESNNVEVHTIRIDNFAAADLVISGLNLSDNRVRRGRLVNASFNVENIGNEASNSTSVYFYLSEDQVIDAADFQLEEVQSISSIQPGQSNSYGISEVLPEDFTVGEYYFIALVDPDDQVIEIDKGNNTAMSLIYITYPDLMPNIDPNMGRVLPGETILFDLEAECSQCENDYSQYPAIEYEFYSSDDGELDGADNLISNGVIALNSDGRPSVQFEYLVPINLEGDHYFILKIDPNDQILELDRLNNVLAEGVTIEEQDFRAVSLDVLYSHVRPAGKIVFSYDIDRQLFANVSEDTRHALLFSEDDLFSAEDQLVVEFEGSNRFNAEAYVPEVLNPGLYHLLLVADYTDLVPENNENNNVISVPIEVEKIDIAFKFNSDEVEESKFYVDIGGHRDAPVYKILAKNKCASIRLQLENPTPILFEHEQRNPDNTLINEFVTEVYFSYDDQITDDDLLIHQKKINSDMAPGSQLAYNFDFRVPDEPLGFYYLIYRTDATDMYEETDESNNEIALLVEIREQDFTVHYSPGPYFIGQNYNLRHRFIQKPFSPCDVPSVEVDYYISKSATIDDEAIPLGSFNRVPDNAWRDLAIDFPDDLVPGEYFLIFHIDPNNLIDEHSEADNVIAKPISVVALDFSVRITEYEPSASPGDNVNVTIEALSGTDVEFPVTLKYNLSSNRSALTENTPLASEMSIEVPGEHSFNFRIPNEIYGGNYYLNVLLDPDQVYWELDRKNNSDSKPITINSFATYEDPPMNYITSYGFDETGPVSSSRTYFDLSGKPLQSQSKSYSTGHVQITQPLRDRYDRSVGNTLAAPANQDAFAYREDFVLNTDGQPFTHADFDLGTNGEPVGASFGTLGWYYSHSNTAESYVPASGFVYSRMEYYDDGTGDVKRSAGVGEELKMGSDHEVYSRVFGVTTELNDYVVLRNKILGYASGPGSLEEETIQSITIDQNGNMSVSFADRSENVIMTAREGNWLNAALYNGEYKRRRSVYFYVAGNDTEINFGPQSVDDDEDIRIYDVRTGEKVYDDGIYLTANLDKGLYRAYSPDEPFYLDYEQSFGDISWNFYDDAGRLIVSIAPNGVEEILSNGVGSYTGAALKDLPFSTYYTYNYQGWLLSTKETDAGLTAYKYRRDGSIRFSQNAEQAKRDDFSYTDYDNLGRPIESGEYTGSWVFDAGLNGRLEDRGFNPWPAADKKDWVRTYYDVPDPDLGTETGLALNQEFVMGAVSYTENEHIKTWYSYDEQGRVTWMAQKPRLLSRTFLIDYDYDFLGNVLSVGFRSYAGATPLDEFYHYYTYDADKRLSSVYTSLQGGLDLDSIATHPDAELQAHYEYYLHGPLKRIELGGNLQGVDFVYNIQGWLKQINHPDTDNDPGGDGSNGFSEDAFGMLLNYFKNNMSNLFGISQHEIKPNPFQFHGLEEGDFKATSLANLYDAINPSRSIRDYSASNPMYLKQLKAADPRKSSAKQ